MSGATVAGFLRIDQPDERSSYPQVGVNSALPSLQAVYWRAACVFFASSRRANADVRHILFTNGEPPTVDGRDLASFLRHLEVELVDVPFTYRPPAGYWGEWGNQFYVLDVIRYLSERPAHFPVVILDLDCVFVGSGRGLFDAVAKHGVANYVVEEIDADPSYVSNGLTTVQLRQLAEELAARPLPHFRYCGGEIFGATWDAASAITAAVPDLWESCLDRYARGLPKLNTEEHFFSQLYASLGLPVGTANGVIRRIWTQRAYRTARDDDLELEVWHLPAEKRFGLPRLFGDVMDRRSTFWQLPPGAAFTRYLGSRLGVPAPTVAKQFRDGLVSMRGRLRA